jgi:hypothetical protein
VTSELTPLSSGEGFVIDRLHYPLRIHLNNHIPEMLIVNDLNSFT